MWKRRHVKNRKAPVDDWGWTNKKSSGWSLMERRGGETRSVFKSGVQRPWRAGEGCVVAAIKKEKKKERR